MLRHYNDPSLSDVSLRIEIVARSPDIFPNQRKRARPEAEQRAVARALHRVVLCRSAYFEAIIRRWATPENVIVERVADEAEREVLEAALKCLYMVEESDGASALPRDTAGLVRVLIEADRLGFDAPSVAPVYARLAAAVSGGARVDSTIVRLTLSLPPERLDHGSIRPLIRACKAYLAERFGDVPAMLVDAGLLADFCGLSHAAVMAWVEIGDLVVFSENCVVVALTAWVRENEASCTPAMLRALARSINLHHVSHVFLHSVLPRIAWLAPCFDGDDFAGLLAVIAIAQRQPFRTWPAAFARYNLRAVGKRPCGMRVHYAGSGDDEDDNPERYREVEQGSGPTTFLLGPDQLAELRDTGSCLPEGSIYLDGFFYKITVSISRPVDDADIAALLWGLAVTVELDDAAMRRFCAGTSAFPASSAFSATLTAGGIRSTLPLDLLIGGPAAKEDNVLDHVAASVDELVGAFLDNHGRLEIKVRLWS